ncbi:ABC transporter substrate-binding protein [Cohnella fermenti]|nr:sugar ABC transporter substrate-binding protein [Cohnella fermenti]
MKRANLSSKTSITVLTAILASGTLLSACGGNSDKQGNAAPSSSAPSASASASGTAAAAAPEVLGVQLTDMDSGGTLHGQYAGQTVTLATVDGDFADAVKTVAPYFEEVSGAKVVVQSFPGETYMEKIQLDLQVTHNFDAVLMPIANLHGFANSGLIQDLTSFTQNAASPNLDLDDFIPALLDVYGKYQGKLIAFPFKPDVELFFYRKDLFEDADIQAKFKEKTGKDLKVPTTADELKETAAFFTRSLNPDSPTDYGYSHMGSKGNSRWIWTNRLGAYGGTDVDENFQPGFNNEAGIQAMQDAVDLKQYAPKEFMELQWETANQLFADGKVAMMEQWPGLYSTVQGDGSAVKDKVGIAVTPGGAPTLGGWGLSVASQSKQSELAYKLIEFIEGKDVQLLMLKHTVDPTRTSNYNRPEISASNTMYPVLFESFSKGKILADVDAPGLSSQLNDIVELGMQEALSGKSTPEKAIEMMAKSFDKELKAAGLQK